MITVQNQRIRVTVTQSVWDSFESKATYLAVRQNKEEVQRGLVLSCAMSKLGNASEHRMLVEEAVDQGQVLKIAKRLLMRDYLAKRSPSTAAEIVYRYANDARIPDSMEKALDEAIAYADGQIGALTRQHAIDAFMAFAGKQLSGSQKASERENARQLKLLELRTTLPKLGNEAINKAEALIREKQSLEIEYRERQAGTDGWTIEIIGPMPQQIGICRYQQRDAV